MHQQIMSGINFYVDVNKCPTCGRSNEIHVGKLTHSYKFCFQKFDNGSMVLGSYREWIDFIEQNGLELRGIEQNNDEERTYTLDEFIQMIDDSMSRTSHLVNRDLLPPDVWNLVKTSFYVDPLGYEFSINTFD